MKTKIYLLILILGINVSCFSQKPALELAFTVENNLQYVSLDSIKIINLTQGGDTTLYSPDSILVLDYITGFEDNRDIRENIFSVSQNYPNPFNGKTTIDLILPEQDFIKIHVRNILGQELVRFEKTLDKGNHSFTFYSGDEKYYLLTISGRQTSKTIKMLNVNDNPSTLRVCELAYCNYEEGQTSLKIEKVKNNFQFDLGDELQYVGFSNSIAGILGSFVISDTPIANTIYEFLIIEGLRCLDAPTILDADGNEYNTVLIGSQCWMKENLKTTTYNNGTPIPSIIDDYEWMHLMSGAYVYYEDDSTWKDLYGALYNWYSVTNVNGLCPEGWYVPGHDDWTQLINYIGGSISPHGNELKSCKQINSNLGGDCNTSIHPRWQGNNSNFGSNDFGFSGLPGGYRKNYGSFASIGYEGYWWSATVIPNIGNYFSLEYNEGNLFEDHYYKAAGLSVCCIRSEGWPNSPQVKTGQVLTNSSIYTQVEGEIIDIGISDVIQHGHCWSTEPNPTINNSKTELGLAIEPYTFTSNCSNLNFETIYFIRAYAINGEGVSYGKELNFKTLADDDVGQSCPDIPTVEDIDGNVYNTIQIGEQCWMRENLKTITYRNGTLIPYYPEPYGGNYHWYDNDESWKDLYGAMYNWYTTIDTNGLCPEGWHVPDHDEWWVFTNSIGGIATPHGDEIKSCRQVESPLGGNCQTQVHPRWEQHDTFYGTNIHGFSALPGGMFDGTGFENIGTVCLWWSTTESNSSFAWFRQVDSFHGDIWVYSYPKIVNMSIRCLKD